MLRCLQSIPVPLAHAEVQQEVTAAASLQVWYSHCTAGTWVSRSPSPHCTVLCTILYCTVLYCTVLPPACPRQLPGCLAPPPPTPSRTSGAPASPAHPPPSPTGASGAWVSVDTAESYILIMLYNRASNEPSRRLYNQGGFSLLKAPTSHCVPEPYSENLKCLHHFYTDNYDSNDKKCHHY